MDPPVLFTLICSFLVFGADPSFSAVDVSSDVTTDSTFFQAQSPYTIILPITISSGKTLTVEPGVEIINGISGNDYMIKVQGSLIAVGTEQAKITFRVEDSGASPRGIDANVGIVDLKYVDARNYDTFMDLYCCYQGKVSVNNSHFENISNVFTGYTGYNVQFRHSTFKKNGRVFESSDKEVYDCIFEENDCAFCDVERFSAYNSTFKNHTLYAMAGRGSNIKNCTIIFNEIGYKQSWSASPTFVNNLIAGNKIGMELKETDGDYMDNNICGNNEWNVYFTNENDLNLNNSYFGSTNLLAVRSHIRDGYHAPSTGRVLVGDVSSATINDAGNDEFSYLCTAPAVKDGFDLSTAALQFGNIFDNLVWESGIYNISVPTTIFAGAAITILPGVQIWINNTLKVKGTLNITGTEADPVIFIPHPELVGDMTAIDTDTGTTTIVYASFERFSNAISLYCCYEGTLEVNDTVFRGNSLAVSGYAGHMTYLRRCTFENNDRVFDSADKCGVDSTFRNNTCAFCSVERCCCHNCLFERHSIAVQGEGRDIVNCTFVNNTIGFLQRYESSFDFTDNLFLENDIAMKLIGNAQGRMITRNDFCSNREWNIFYTHDDTTVTAGNYFASDNLTVVRNSIRDAYHTSGVGLVKLNDSLHNGVLSYPGMERVANEGLNCQPIPMNDSFSLDNALKFGNILEDTTWDSGDRVIAVKTTVLSGATLTIGAGVTVTFMDTLLVKGKLVVQGTSSNLVHFRAGKDNTIGISQDTSGRVTIEHATFEDFGSAIDLLCCGEFGASVNDSTFRNNSVAVSGYFGGRSYFRRSLFENNTRVCTNADYQFEDCKFDSNGEVFSDVERTYAYRCLFSNNNVAISGNGGDIMYNIIVNNTIGLHLNNYNGGFDFKRNLVTGNGIGVKVGKEMYTFEENMVCGNAEWNVHYSGDFDDSLACNWLGVGSDLQARKKVSDGYRGRGVGTLAMTPIWMAPQLFLLSNNTYNVPLHRCVVNPCDARRDCSGNGLCNVDNGCECLPGWSGDDCGVCDLGFKPTVNGPRCKLGCSEHTNCSTCLSQADCSWCVQANGNGVCASISNHSVSCQSREEERCTGEQFAVSESSFERTGTIVSITFNLPTDRAGYTNSFFECAFVFEFQTLQWLGSGRKCKWDSLRKLQIYLGSEFRLRPNGLMEVNETSVSFMDDVIHVNGTNTALSIDGDPQNTVQVAPPTEVPRPTAIVKVPSFTGNCGDLLLDGSSSYDPTGRMKAQWVCEEGCSTELLYGMLTLNCKGDACKTQDEMGMGMGGVQNDNCPKLGSDNTSLSVVIPRSMLQDNIVYKFRLYVSNLFGFVIASDEVNVTKLASPVLTVRMTSPLLVTKRSKQLEVRVQVKLPECGISNPTLPRLSYSWSWDSDVDITEIQSAAAGARNGVITRGSSLFILPYTLGFNPNYTYSFNVTVQDDSGYYTGGAAYTLVRVIQEPLSLSIEGDGSSFKYTEHVTLTALAVDPMSDAENLRGSFDWSCFKKNAEGSIEECTSGDFDLQDISDANEVLSLTPPQNGFNTGLYQFVLSWQVDPGTDQAREAIARAEVNIATGPSATIEVKEPRPAVKSNKKLIIASTDELYLHAVNASMDATVDWRVFAGNDSEGIGLENITRTNPNSVDFIIKANSLEEGEEYLIQLTMTENGIQGTAEMTLLIELPPQGGTFNVDPCDNGVGGETDFKLSTGDWRITNVDSPTWELRFSFGYTLNGTSRPLTSQYSPDSQFTTKLPAGNLTIWTSARTPSGAESRAERTCYVNPGSGSVDAASMSRNISETLDDRDSRDSLLTATAQRVAGMPDSDVTQNITRTLMEAKAMSMNDTKGVPPTKDSLAKDASDIQVLLPSNRSFDSDTKENATQIVSDVSEGIKDLGADESTGGNALSACGVLSTQGVNNSDQLRSAVQNVESGLAKMAATDGKPVSVSAGTVTTVVQRVSNSSAKNLDCGDGTNACASTPDDLGDATSGETAVLAMTRWARNSYAGICSGSQCDSIQSELVSLRLENSTSGENIEVDNLNGNFTLKISYPPTALVDTIKCVFTKNGSAVDVAGCHLDSIDTANHIAVCKCNHLTYFAVVADVPTTTTSTTTSTTTTTNSGASGTGAVQTVDEHSQSTAMYASTGISVSQGVDTDKPNVDTTVLTTEIPAITTAVSQGVNTDKPNGGTTVSILNTEIPANTSADPTTTLPPPAIQEASASVKVKGTTETFDQDNFKSSVVQGLNSYCAKGSSSCGGSSSRKRRDTWTPITSDAVVILSLTQEGEFVNVVFYIKTSASANTPTYLPSDVLKTALNDPDTQTIMKQNGYEITSVSSGFETTVPPKPTYPDNGSRKVFSDMALVIAVFALAVSL